MLRQREGAKGPQAWAVRYQMAASGRRSCDPDLPRTAPPLPAGRSLIGVQFCHNGRASTALAQGHVTIRNSEDPIGLACPACTLVWAGRGQGGLPDHVERVPVAHQVVGSGVTGEIEVNAEVLHQQLALEGEQPALVGLVKLKQGVLCRSKLGLGR
jgi:hypothetical protein